MKKLSFEKYRPKTLHEYVWRDDEQKKQVQTWIKEKSIPHLLLSGTPGIGKTTMAKMLINEIGIEDYDVLEINASRERGLDLMKEKITNFVSMIAFGPFRVVLLDEADRLTPFAQDALKGVMEEYSNFSRFILTCNTQSMIVPAIHSRCQQFHFTRLDPVEFTARAATILVNEEIDFELDVLDTYVKTTYPDLRKCINLLQQNSRDSKLHTPNQNDTGTLEWKFDMVELFKAGKITEARKMICGKVQADEIIEIYRWLYNNLGIFGSEDNQDKAILIIKQGLVDHPICADPEINLSATLIRLSKLNA
jgi:replication factor C small subunit